MAFRPSISACGRTNNFKIPLAGSARLSLKKRVAIVSGAGRGLGRSYAPEQARTLVDLAVTSFGAVDIVVDNAGNCILPFALTMESRGIDIEDPGDIIASRSVGAGRRWPTCAALCGTFSLTHRKEIIEFAALNRLPAIYGSRALADSGGLLSYGPDLSEMFGRAAYFVDRIIKGAKPADMPVEQPIKYELFINQTTARALGLTIPQSLLLRADEVIQRPVWTRPDVRSWPVVRRVSLRCRSTLFSIAEIQPEWRVPRKLSGRLSLDNRRAGSYCSNAPHTRR